MFTCSEKQRSLCSCAALRIQVALGSPPPSLRCGPCAPPAAPASPVPPIRTAVLSVLSGELPPARSGLPPRCPSPSLASRLVETAKSPAQKALWDWAAPARDPLCCRGVGTAGGGGRSGATGAKPCGKPPAPAHHHLRAEREAQTREDPRESGLRGGSAPPGPAAVGKGASVDL